MRSKSGFVVEVGHEHFPIHGRENVCLSGCMACARQRRSFICLVGCLEMLYLSTAKQNQSTNADAYYRCEEERLRH